MTKKYLLIAVIILAAALALADDNIITITSGSVVTPGVNIKINSNVVPETTTSTITTITETQFTSTTIQTKTATEQAFTYETKTASEQGFAYQTKTASEQSFTYETKTATEQGYAYQTKTATEYPNYYETTSGTLPAGAILTPPPYLNYEEFPTTPTTTTTTIKTTTSTTTTTAPIIEPAPDMNIWVEGAQYKQAPVNVTSKPKIAFELTIDNRYSLANDVTVVLDPGTTGSRTITIPEDNIQRTVVDGRTKRIYVNYQFTATLNAGTHKLQITGSSSGREGVQTSVSKELQLVVGAYGGEVAVLGEVIVFPTPYDPARGSAVIKYQLSKDADIDVMLVAANGIAIKKWTFAAGDQGARSGSNTITWDGTTFSGLKVSNGFYIGIIFSGQKKLKDFKLIVAQTAP